MSEIQDHLLMYMKEIDTLCRENGIEYYLDGGTLIGAKRHEGFLPWDDDCDIFMDRKNWDKFVALYKSGGFPENRELQCPEVNRDYPNVFGRYVDLTSTAIHANQLCDDQQAGMIVDIFPFDPAPDGEEARKQYLSDLWLYNEMHNRQVQYSIRMETNQDRYRESIDRVMSGHREEVCQELEEKLFRYNEEDVSCYSIRWAGIPFFPEKELFEGHIDGPFEDATMMWPVDTEKYLVEHFGPDWYQVPKVTERQNHMAIYNFNIDYKTMRSQYFDKQYDKEKIRDALLNRRLVRLENAQLIHERMDDKVKLRVAAVSYKVEQNIKALEVPLSQLAEEGRYAEIAQVFKPYIDYAPSRNCVGRLDFTGIYRMYHPILPEIGQENFELMIKTLVYCGYLTKTIRLLDAYRILGGQMTPVLSWAQEYLDEVDAADLHFWKKEFAQAKPLVDNLLIEHPKNQHLLYMKICIQMNEGDYRGAQATLTKAQELYPKDGELYKCQGDIQIAQGKVMDALISYYRSSLFSNNGLIALDIRHWIKENIDLVIRSLDIGKICELDHDEDVLHSIENQKEGGYVIALDEFVYRVPREDFLEYLCERSGNHEALVAKKYDLLIDVADDSDTLLALAEELLEEPMKSNPAFHTTREKIFTKFHLSEKEKALFKTWDQLYLDGNVESFIDKIDPADTSQSLINKLTGDALMKTHRIKDAFALYRKAAEQADNAYVTDAVARIFREEMIALKDNIIYGKYPKHILARAYELRFNEKLSCEEIVKKADAMQQGV